MDKIPFNARRSLSIGIEVEVQLLHNRTLNLEPKSVEILNILGKNKNFHPELFQSMLEVITDVCDNVHEIEKDIKRSFLLLHEACTNLGLKYATTGTHPFAKYNKRRIFPLNRYQMVMNRKQWIAKRLCVFGLHVHVGMKTKESCIDFMNMFQWFLPYFIALSSSSPFWQAQNTGLHSSRLTVFESSPTSGHCSHLNNWAEFEQQITLLTNCGSIHSMKDIWWDIRPSMHGTIEIRICDGVATLHELLGIVSLIHAIAYYYNKYRWAKNNKYLFDFSVPCPLWLIREHKWRALRYGVNMNIITTVGTNISFEEAMEEVLRILQPTINDLGYNKYMLYLKQIVLHGSSSKRQLDLYARYNSLKKIAELNACECQESFINNKNLITSDKNILVA